MEHTQKYKFQQAELSMQELQSVGYKYWRQWKLITSAGRQFWSFIPPEELQLDSNGKVNWNTPVGKLYLENMRQAFKFDKNENVNSSDKVYRSRFDKIPDSLEGTGLKEGSSTSLEEKVNRSIRKGFSFYSRLQTADGNWPGDYAGPMFLLPGLIFVSYITKTQFDIEVRPLMKQYMLNHQNSDGGWGLHIEGDSTMFGTVLQYVALRILGMKADENEMIKAREWIQLNGGATYIPPWGKFYLSVLGLYEWKGNDSLFPEMWILPRWLPFHPGRFWCHSRMVYLPMSYCYGMKLRAETTDLIDSLKNEIYPEDYNMIDWKASRDRCAHTDKFQKVSWVFKLFNFFANIYEKVHIKSIRQKALGFIMEYIDTEDRDTTYVNIGPVNKVVNSLCCWHHHGSGSEQFKRHTDRWKDYLWLAEDGMKMNGYNGSQLWDTAFAGQALVESKLANEFSGMANKIRNYLDISQIKRDPDNCKRYFRTPSKGGWPFSTEEHGWPITDCTAEGLKTTLLLNDERDGGATGDMLYDMDRLKGAVDFLLLTQNQDGGWATYEEKRAPSWLEKLNPSHIFGKIMPDYSYVECTSSAMQGLNKYMERFPEYRADEIKLALTRGKAFIKNIQGLDGSWYGSWGICFTYGCLFGIEGLLAAGESSYKENEPASNIRRACEFLAEKQNQDGSWGESYLSSVRGEYVNHIEGQLVNTSWALLALLAADYPDKKLLERGIHFILDKQLGNGDWPQQSISGVFNGNCMITYTSYRNIFPLWALGRYLNKYVVVD